MESDFEKNMSNTILFRRYGTFFFILLCISLFLFFIGESVHADHLPGTASSIPPLQTPGPLNNTNFQPCRDVGTIVENRPIQVIQGQPGSGAGEVPVYDNDASRNLVILISALQREAQYTELQDGDVQRTAEYLRLLCEKEYEEDHALQHAWASLIGDFVNETINFIRAGNNGNPAFLTNQTAYYQLVNIAVARVFMQDIVDSNIGSPTKREIIRGVARSLFDNKFPYTGTVLMADPTVPDQLSADGVSYVADVYWGELLDHIQDPDARNDAVQKQAISDLQKRLAQQLAQEQEKLAWGRGFFSYEVCDLEVYLQANDPLNQRDDTVNPEDRRNCRIITPGSLIQDQTSFVFGSALRQMEINDEYEEWIAPNTLAVLSDVLSYRGFNSFSDSRTYSNPPVVRPGRDAASPVTVRSTVDITSPPAQQNNDGPPPFEFDTVIDYQLTPSSQPGQQGGGIGTFGNQFIGVINPTFQNVLDPTFFLQQIP